VTFVILVFITGTQAEDITETGKEVFFSFTGILKFSSFSLATQIIIYIGKGFFKYPTSYILKKF
jgi:hypothetical protein